jgi:drug/metabolite transporter (DMT)-like permease
VGLGLLGVLAFSFSLPANKLAVAGLDPLSITALRAAGGGLLAGAYLLFIRAGVPTLAQLRDLGLSALGVVIGFPLFSTLAVLTSGTGHGGIILGLLPAVTAMMAAWLGGEALPRTFWIACLSGVTILIGYLTVASYQQTGAITLRPGDLWMLAATGVGAYGYNLGGRQAAIIGGPQSISWALVLTLPLSVPASVVVLLHTDQHWTPSVLFGLGYLILISQFLGFFAWYGGLVRGGIGRIAQTQQVQPLLTLVWASLFLGEAFNPWTIVVALAIAALVAVAQRARFSQTGTP